MLQTMFISGPDDSHSSKVESVTATGDPSINDVQERGLDEQCSLVQLV